MKKETDNDITAFLYKIKNIEDTDELEKFLEKQNLANQTLKEILPFVLKIVDKLKTDHKEIQQLKDSLEAVPYSPYLPNSVSRLFFRGIIDRDWVVNSEFNQGINEKHGSAYIFKERAREFASIIGLDGDAMRIAATEAIQNIIEYGYGRYAEIELLAENTVDNPFIEMSFKHSIPENSYYSLDQANDNANKGMLDFENSRGRGEFMMMNLMDERRFLNGCEEDENGNNTFFFKRILRKYKDPAKIQDTEINIDCKKCLENIEDYTISFFFNKNKHKNNTLTLASSLEDFKIISPLLSGENFELDKTAEYKNFYLSYWNPPRELNIKDMEEILRELKYISTRVKKELQA